ncbi:hypothetical protein HID58_029328, partial [Brassica napus]
GHGHHHHHHRSIAGTWSSPPSSIPQERKEENGGGSNVKWTRERQRESSSEILLPRLLRFFFLIFDSSSLCSIHLPLLCSSSGSPSNLRFSFDGQKQAFVVVGRVSTGTEAKLKVLYGSGARKFARSCCSSWLTSHEGIVS